MRKPFVIGFMGYAGVGKTTAAKIFKLQHPMDVGVASFATPLKEAVRELFLLSDDQLYGSEKELIDERWGKSPRQILQIVGTDCLRNLIDPKFHVKRMAAYLEQTEYPIVIVDDIRFDGEAELVNQYGVCYQIQRPGFPKDSIRHASEYPPTHLASGYYILNNQPTVGAFSDQLLMSNSYIKNLILEKLNAAH